MAGKTDLDRDGQAGAGQAVTATREFRIAGLHCADCAETIEKNLAALPGVAEARVDYALARLVVTHAPSLAAEEIARVVRGSGYEVAPVRGGRAPREERPFWVRNRQALLTAGAGSALAAGFAAALLGFPNPYPQAFFALAIVLGGYHVARSGVYALLRSRTLDMNTLMSIAVLGAVAIGEWAEGATVAFLFALGNALEGYTMDRARGAIRALMDLAPNEARVRRNGGEESVAAEEVAIGEVVAVRPGERIPLDGRVIAGTSTVDQAPITGESLPVAKKPGDEVYAGTINERGYLEVEVTKPYVDNTIAKIIHLVEEAQAQRAPSQRFVDRFARAYTPAVIAAAAAVAILPWLAFGQPLHVWLYRALVLLVVACPCALVISTPVSIVSALARAASQGVLIKGGVHLEQAGQLRAVAFDKTGTLTAGRPEVTDVVPLNGLAPAEVLRLAAAVEAPSEHPLAAAVLRAANGGDERAEPGAVVDFEAVTGKGVRASLDGTTYYVGSPRFFAELGLPRRGVPLRDTSDTAGLPRRGVPLRDASEEAGLPRRGVPLRDAADSDIAGLPAGDVEATLQALGREGKTVLLVGTEQEILGIIAVADRLRPGAKEAVAALRREGVEHVALLTGDHERTARAVAAAVGADEQRAALLPAEKMAAVRELRARYGRVAMVGDGVNDAPALAAANVGIAMGVAGTDAALETADVALLSDDLHKVAYAMALSRRALATIRQNIAFALALKAAFLALALPGLATLWMAIAADMGASLLVTLNGMRLLRYRGPAVAHGAGGHACGAGLTCACGEEHA